MSRLLLLAAFVASAAAATHLSTPQDATLTPGATGADVVEKTLDIIRASCIFTDDKLLMRRIAFVETGDGERIGGGGLWKIDESKFNKLKQGGSRIQLARYTKLILNAFNINWDQITFADMSKPRVSALAARLFLQLLVENDQQVLTHDVLKQAELWATFYSVGADKKIFLNIVNQLDTGCGHAVDLAFALDSSQSMGEANFEAQKQFVKDVVKTLNIGPDATRVSVLKYSSGASLEIGLTSYSSVETIVEAVDRIQFDGGRENTSAVLSALYEQTFSTQFGARRTGVPNIGIVITDGQSDNPTQTILNGMKAQTHDITLIAVGVGSSVPALELDAIASTPQCLHKFTLTSNEIHDLKYAIEQSACDAPVIFNRTKVEVKLPSGDSENCIIKVPEGGVTAKIAARSGAATMFLSEKTYPSKSYHSSVVEAVQGIPGVIFLEKPNTMDTEGIVYCSIENSENVDTDLEINPIPGNKDFCRSSACQNGARCLDDLISSYRCLCTAYFEGYHCDKPINPCKPNPCKKGTCHAVDGGGYTCTCKEGWTGTNCNEASNVCKKSNPCVHGNCTSLGTSYECCCEHGYTKQNCDEEIDECESDPCMNGGRCVDKVNGYTCMCAPGFSGIHCEIEDNECKSNPCMNGADCHDLVNSYKCVCKDGWTGTHCETDIPDCDSQPCQNDGTCIDGTNRYTCVCEPGWTGKNCETNIPDCIPDPCVNGDCIDLVNDYKCVCVPGWTSKDCEINIPECESDPCVHGDCTDGINRYDCRCHDGYEGVNCEHDIKECKSNPCQHGATCHERIPGYVCECVPGYMGTHCEILLPVCDSDPCQHGVCIGKVNAYECQCHEGWEGANCDCVIDNCKTVPCDHGVCVNSIGGYTCVCNEGFTGDSCDKGDGTDPGNPGDGDRYDCITRSPCTAANRAKGLYYFAHIDDEKFVQCDEWGGCFVMPCGEGTRWSQEALTCVHK